ncbi:MAG: ice-binding family protein [Paludibacter sp.]|nr:ice-binding family protein [Paludibacter sp.]
MKFRNALPVLAMLMFGFMVSCSNELDSSLASRQSDKDKSSESITEGKNNSEKDSLDQDRKHRHGENDEDHGHKHGTGNDSIPVIINQGTVGTVNLGTAGNFAILSKSGITDVYKSTITGDLGASPITGAAIQVSCAEVTGTIYTVDAAGPLPCRVTNASMLTTAVSDMQTAYTDIAGRTNPNFLNLGAGNIGGMTLTAGLYKWTTTLNIPTNITISGSATDVFIFQVAGNLTMGSAVNITLTGGAQAKNIFWQSAGSVTLGSTSHFEGNVLCMTAINMLTNATINGRMLAQTAVTLQMNTVTIAQ